MTTSRQIPVTLYPSRVRTAVYCLCCLLFVAGGVLMVRAGEPKGYFVVGFFALCLPVFALQFHPKAAYLHLDTEGFTYCGAFRPHTTRWSDVEEFFVVSLHHTRMVGWNFRPEYLLQSRSRAFSRSVSGYEAVISSTYGFTASDLAEWMETLRQIYGTRPAS